MSASWLPSRCPPSESDALNRHHRGIPKYLRVVVDSHDGDKARVFTSRRAGMQIALSGAPGCGRSTLFRAM